MNGKILTMDGQSRTAEAVAIRDGKFLAIGDSATIRSMAGSATRTIDLAGKAVVPGLIDTHAHFKAAGLADYVVNMSRAKTVAEALEAIKQFVTKKQPGDWIIGSAWHPPSQLAEKRYLTRQEIDSVAPNNPVYLRTVGHFSMANTLALAKAGVDKDTPNPGGGIFERDASGELTGVLVETAIDQVEKAVPTGPRKTNFASSRSPRACSTAMASPAQSKERPRLATSPRFSDLPCPAKQRFASASCSGRSRQRKTQHGKRSCAATARRRVSATTG